MGLFLFPISLRVFAGALPSEWNVPHKTFLRLAFSYDSYLRLNIIPHKCPTNQPFLKQHLTTSNSHLHSSYYLFHNPGLFFWEIITISNEFFNFSIHCLPPPTRMKIPRSQVAFMYCTLLYSVSRRVFDSKYTIFLDKWVMYGIVRLEWFYSF